MGLSSILATKLTDTVADDQGKWRQFILDHLDYIAARSVSYLIQPEVMNLYQFDLTRFLTERMQRRQDIAWIVLLLNSLPNDFSFVESREYIIPSDDLILALYGSFRTTTSNSK